MRNNQVANMNMMMLLTLEALYLTRKTTLAAEKIHVTQPSISMYLRQLRELTGDELFVRTAKGLEPTDTCTSYYEAARAILDSVEAFTRRQDNTFDPARTPASYSVVIPFLKSRMFISELSVGLAKKYPRLKVDMISQPEKETLRQMEEGAVDLYIGLLSEKLEKHFSAQRILTTDLVVLCSKHNRHYRQGRIGKAEYLDTPHIKATASFAPSLLDAKFRSAGLLQKTLVSVPDVWAEVALLRETDYLLVIDRSDLAHITAHDDFQVLKTDFDFPKFDMYAVWHLRSKDTPQHIWYRDYLFKLCKKLDR